MRLKELASPFVALAVPAGLALGLLTGCAGQRVAANVAAASADAAIRVDTAIRTTDWGRTRSITILLADGAVAPLSTDLVVGQPTRLTIRNTGDRTHTFGASAFFGAVAVRIVAEATEPPVPRQLGYPAAKMEEIAFHGVGKILGLTPHEQTGGPRNARNPFDTPPAPATPIDFGDLLGDLGALGADPFGLNAAKPPDPFGGGVLAPPAAATPVPANPAPANPFDVLGQLQAAPPAPPAPPAPAPQPAPQVAAVEPGLDLEREGQLLRTWGPSLIAGIDAIRLGPGESVQITLVPLRAGTYAISESGRLAGFAARGAAIRILPSGAPLPAEIAGPAADYAMLGTETKATEAPKN